MEALKCPHCGARHWPRQPCPATKPKPTARARGPTLEQRTILFQRATGSNRAAARERLLNSMAEAMAAKPVTNATKRNETHATKATATKLPKCNET
jgi:hypothetical protein